MSTSQTSPWTETVNNVLMTLIIGSLIVSAILGIGYFTWDYNVQYQIRQSEENKERYAQAMEVERTLQEMERTRQEWIKTIEKWDGKMLIVPERLVTPKK